MRVTAESLDIFLLLSSDFVSRAVVPLFACCAFFTYPRTARGDDDDECALRALKVTSRRGLSLAPVHSSIFTFNLVSLSSVCPLRPFPLSLSVASWGRLCQETGVRGHPFWGGGGLGEGRVQEEGRDMEKGQGRTRRERERERKRSVKWLGRSAKVGVVCSVSSMRAFSGCAQPAPGEDRKMFYL